MSIEIKDSAAISDVIDDGNKTQKGYGHIQKTKVIINEVLPNGKKIFREAGQNKVNVSGSEFHARKDFNFGTGKCYATGNKDANGFYPKTTNITTYDEAFEDKGYVSTVPAGIPVFTNGDMSNEEARKIYLFAVGIDGCGLENSRRFTVQKNDWISPYGPAPDGLTPEGDPTVTTCLIPFRCVDTEEPKGPGCVVPEYYQGAFNDTTLNKTLYFFKQFDNAPELSIAFGTTPVSEIGESVWDYESSEALECVVKLTLSVTKEDVKEWFALCGMSDTCKVNTISLISAVPYIDTNDKIWYKDFRPVTKYNMTNKPLTDPNSGLQITYLLYY